MDYSPPGFFVHGIFQARILEWVAISFSRGSSRLRNRTHISCVFCIGRQSLPLSHLGSPLLLPKECLINRVRRKQDESDLRKLAFEMVLGFRWLTQEQGRQGAMNLVLGSRAGSPKMCLCGILIT